MLKIAVTILKNAVTMLKIAVTILNNVRCRGANAPNTIYL